MSHPLTIRDTTKIQRPHLLNSYVENMVKYLMVANGGLTEEHIIRDFVRQTVMRTLRRPKLKCVAHKSYGNACLDEVDLLDHVKNTNDRVIMPSGSIYKPATETVSFLKEQIGALKARRGSSKNLMLKYKAEGNESLANYYNSDQSLQKISMNSIAGAMGSNYSFLTDLAGFNSITSTGRYFIMSSYANCERFLEGNYFFPTKESIINHCTVLARIAPDKETIDRAIHSLGITHTDVGELFDFFNANYQKYRADTLPPALFDWLSKLPTHVLTFIFYSGNLKHLVRRNSDHWMKWIAKFYSKEDIIYDATVQPEALFKLDGDLIIIVSTIYSELLPIVDGKKVNVYDTVVKYPELAVKLACIGRYMQSVLDEVDEAFQLFMMPNTIISDVFNHKNMYRSCVIASDTDSIIFTTKSWLEWFTGSLAMGEGAYQINSLVVYWLSKVNASLMNVISQHKGAVNEDISGMKMKNEYFYPIMSLCNIKKHYAGMYLIQEGMLLPKMKSDIKGVQFKGSNLCGTTLAFIKNFIDTIHETIVRDGRISATACIEQVIGFEREVYDSLMAGATQYLPIKPVKNASDYKDDQKSLYYNYQAWQYVFAPKYGSIDIPTKCYILPLGSPSAPEYLTYLEQQDPEIYNRLIGFVEKHPKELTRIPINPLLDKVPDELIPLMKVKSIVADNCSPLYLFMRSLGLTVGNTSKTRLLYSDVYGWCR